MALGTLRNGTWIKQVPSPYSKQQIVEWLNVIRYTELMDLSLDKLSGAVDLSTHIQPNLDNLVTLTRLHLVAFPFESTPIHYSRSHGIDISYERVYRRLVVEGSGHYCYGKNGLLLGMLRGLGYRAYGGQARINISRNSKDPNAPLDYTQLVHLLLFVQPFPQSNVTYVVDTAFGVGGLARPILLSDDKENIVLGATPLEKHRLRKAAHPESSIEDPADEHWRLEVLHETDQPFPKWKVIYSFAETEFFQRDFEAGSYYASSNPRGSRFVTQVVCVRFFWIRELPDDLKRENSCNAHQHAYGNSFPLKGVDISNLMVGYISLCDFQLVIRNGPLPVNVHRRELKNEQERIDVIRNMFGISLEHDADGHIRGRTSTMRLC